MDCPRCGFTQPKDQYCAKCGIDVEAYQKKPPNLFVRMANSSNFHLGVIIAIIVATLFYLVVSQRRLIQQEVGRILEGIPLLSSRAVDEEVVEQSMEGVEEEIPQAETMMAREDTAMDTPSTGIIEPGPNTNQPAVSKAPPQVEVRYLEVSKENIAALIASGRLVRDMENWRVVYLPSSPSVQSILRASRPLPGSVRQALPPQGDLEILSGDYDPDPTRSFLSFSMIWRIPDSVEWSLITQLRSAGEATPQLLLREYEGTMKWSPQGALILIFDPLTRITAPSEEDLSRSPLRILRSPDFQSGISDLIIWVEVTNSGTAF